MTTESARLVGLLAELADFFEPNDLSASSIIRQAAALLRSQAEELERLRGALLHIVAIANTRDIEDTEAGFKPRKSAVHVPYKLVNRARAALGER